jgi:hypothetical protein
MGWIGDYTTVNYFILYVLSVRLLPATNAFSPVNAIRSLNGLHMHDTTSPTNLHTQRTSTSLRGILTPVKSVNPSGASKGCTILSGSDNVHYTYANNHYYL